MKWNSKTGKDPAGKTRYSKRRFRRIVAGAVTAAVVLSVAGGSYGAWAAGLAQSNYRWFTDNPDAGTYTLTTPGDVYSFAEIVNGTQPSTINGGQAYDFEGKTVQIAVGSNPSISDKPSADQTPGAGKLPLNALGTHYEFEPIGTEAHPFQGNFNGNGATLLNMLIDTDIYGTKNLGLFGVVGEKATLSNFTVTGDIVLDNDKIVDSIGGVAGSSKGTIQNVTSQVNVTIENSYSPNKEVPAPMNRIGGVVGITTGSLSSCTYQNANLTVRSAAEALNELGWSASTVAAGIGGVAGVVGSMDEAMSGMTVSDCYNSANLYVCLTGTGGQDEWGTKVDAKSSDVGGIVGYSNASILRCGNSGEVRTSARGADTGGSGGTYDTTNDNGASRVAGVCGTLTNGGSGQLLTVELCWNKGTVTGCDNVGGVVGSASSYTLITQCSNGNALAENANVMADQDTMPDGQGSVISTRWNKPMTGGVVATSNGTVSYCDNRGLVYNRQSGYYTAGICSGLGYSGQNDRYDLPAEYTPEVYGCYNVGQISPNHPANQRFAALVGNNRGYVHDCVVRQGSVAIGEGGASYPIGGNVWGRYDNLETYSSADLKTATATKVLNAQCFKDGDYSLYWFTGKETATGGANYNDGFPVLTTWATPLNGLALDASRLEELEVKDALFTSDQVAGNEPVPTVRLSYYTDNGDVVELKQNGDYLIVPEEGAFDRSDDDEMNPTPYKYSIKGIGAFMGEVLDFGSYGIGTGVLEDMTAIVDQDRVFNWGVQFPESVEVVDAAGQVLDPSNYSYVIYDSNTNNTTSEIAPMFTAFDSEGTVEFPESGTVVPAMQAVPIINANPGTAFKVKDRNGQLVSDGEGFIYDEYGDNVTGRKVVKSHELMDGVIQQSIGVVVGSSCLAYKPEVTTAEYDHNGAAGYVVDIIGKGDFEGAHLTGQFVIQQPDLEEDCETTVTMPDGSIYSNANERRAFIRIDDDASDNHADTPTLPFAAEPYEPTVSVSWQGRELTQQDWIRNDYSDSFASAERNGHIAVGYGGENTTYGTPEYLTNRNATVGNSEYTAGVQARAVSSVAIAAEYPVSYNVFSGYIDFNFAIEAAVPNDVEVQAQNRIAISNTKDSAEGAKSIPAPVSLTLNGMSLIEGLDYALEYKDSLGAPLSDDYEWTLGDYSVNIHLLEPNFVDQLDVSEYSFSIVETKHFNVRSEYRGEEYLPFFGDKYVGEYIEDTNWAPEELYPELIFVDADTDEQLDLVFGRDYEFTIGSSDYEDVSWKPINVNRSTGNPELLPFAPGTSDSLMWFFGMAEHRDRPVQIRIQGLGEYAGMDTISVFWRINRLDMSETDLSDWDYLMPSMQYGGWRTSGSVYIAETGIPTFVSYRGFYAYYSGYIAAVPLLNLRTDPARLEVGKPAHWVLQPNLSGSPFKGTLVLPDSAIVESADLSTQDLSLSIKSALKYDGGAKTPRVIAAGSYDVTDDPNVNVNYENNIDAGFKTVVVTGQDDYSGRVKLGYVISQRDMQQNANNLFVEAIEQQRYTGEPVEPKVSITDNGLSSEADESRKQLVEGRDYELSYTRNTDVGTGHVFITGIGNYTGTIEKLFKIVADEDNVSYYVECVDVLNPNRVVQAPIRFDGNKAGETATATSPVIPGWHVVPLDSEQVEKSITLSASERNAITFQYLKDGLSLPEQVEDISLDLTIYNTNWYAAAKASVQPDNADQTVTWSSSDLGIAQINSKGYIRAYEDGIVDITATSVRDPEISGSKSLIVVGQDDETPFSKETAAGVSMDGVPSGSKLVVNWESSPNVSVGDESQIAGAYDVKLYATLYDLDDEGNRVNTGKPDMDKPIQPLGNVDLYFPVPAGVDASKLQVLHWDEDRQTYEEEESVLSEDGKYLVVTTDHLSLFTVMAPMGGSSSGDQQNPPAATDPGNSGIQNPSGSMNNGGDYNGGTPWDEWVWIPATTDQQGGSNKQGGSNSGSSLSGQPSGASGASGSSQPSSANASGTPETPEAALQGNTLDSLADTGEPLASSGIEEISAPEDDLGIDWLGMIKMVLLILCGLAVAAGIALAAYLAYVRRPRRVVRRF